MSLDMIIEVTMNKGYKIKSGCLLVQSWNCNNIACISNTVHRYINTIKGAYKHTESSSRRMKEDDYVVQDLLNCISQFECFPINCSNSSNYSVCNTFFEQTDCRFEICLCDGEVKPIKFLEERILTKVKSLFNSVTKITVLPFHFKRKKLLHQVWINWPQISWRVWDWLQL